MRLVDADALSELLVKTYETAPTEKALLFVALLLKNNEQVPTVDIKDQIAGAYNEGYACGGRESKRPQVEWIDHSEEGYVECPFCEHLTNCEDNIDELHYCWNCGAQTISPYKAIHDELHKGGNNG